MNASGITRHQFFGAADCTLHAFGIRSASHFGTQGPHDRDFFFGKTFRNEERDFVAALHTDEGETDAGVAGGGFDDCAAGLEAAFFFGAQNDSAGGAIFHAAAGIQVFQLGVHCQPHRREASFFSCRMGVSPTSWEMSSVTRRREASMVFVLTLQGTEARAERQL